MAEFIAREKINEIAFTDAVLVKGEVKTERIALLREIDEIPAADVREVVLCKDCKFSEAGAGGVWCKLRDDRYVKADYFCADGERKTIPGDDLKDLVGELLSLNAENLAQRCIDNSDVEWCLGELMDMLTADMEAVTRCKDCKHYDRDQCYHPRHERHQQAIPQFPADYCSYGEKKHE